MGRISMSDREQKEDHRLTKEALGARERKFKACMQSATIREKGRRNKNLSEEKQHENKSQAPIFSIKQKAAPL